MRSTLRIAIFECDELAGEMQKEYGSISNLYKKLFEAGASKLAESGLYERPNLDFSSYDVVKKQEYPDVENIDCVFLTGGRVNNWILKLVDFINTILQDNPRVRIMGVCFGHQIIGRAYGVTPKRNDAGWEVSVTSMTLTERGKQIFGQDSLALHQMHYDIVPWYPPSVEKLGHTDRCEVQGMYVKNRVISLQGHPEYTEKIGCEFLERRRGSALDEATYQDGKNRVYNPHDGLIVGAAFVKFLLED
ncbi:class I glutamine amidotransferase-like protein [Trichoderma evansii]